MLETVLGEKRIPLPLGQLAHPPRRSLLTELLRPPAHQVGAVDARMATWLRRILGNQLSSRRGLSPQRCRGGWNKPVVGRGQVECDEKERGQLPLTLLLRLLPGLSEEPNEDATDDSGLQKRELHVGRAPLPVERSERAVAMPIQEGQKTSPQRRVLRAGREHRSQPRGKSPGYGQQSSA